ncbi:MAG: cation-translocating P-type ATPase [Bacteroidales bacterium]
MPSTLNEFKVKGLSSRAAASRLALEGYNELPSSKPKNIFQMFLSVIIEPMFILLVICGSLYMLLGDIEEGLILLSFVIVIMAIEFYQEKKTEKALNALKDLASPRALVIRDGIETRIPGREVVREDVIFLKEGDRVPADARIIFCTNLLADESLLTGESVPVRKLEWKEADNKVLPGGDDLPYVFSGSMIVQGSGLATVYAVGSDTEIGKIGKAIENVKEDKTPLQKEIASLVKTIALAGMALCILVIIAYTVTRGSAIKGVLAGITLAMAMLPEEFPVVLSIFMAMGAWRMSKRKVLTRKPSAIETLGSATVLCTDKTGTLTLNKMNVNCLYNGYDFHFPGEDHTLPEEFHEVIEFGILSSQSQPFDPMEKAILNIGDRFLQGTEHLHFNKEMIREYPLSRELLAMSRVFSEPGTSDLTIAAKGAPEAIFDLCHLPEEKNSILAKAVEQMAIKGLRVIGVAKSLIEPQDVPDIQHDFEFEFVGLIGLNDPIRENVKDAVAECHQAGIRVIMITGDYPVTAVNIAKEIGLVNPESCITGQELEVMAEEELQERIRHTHVFARVVPDQKLKIVTALKKNGETVAMTGDGINDAPALKSANIGIAMGDKGTDVAREASSLVLMDDNFLSIVGAIRMGRRISDNLQKALGYIFAIHMPIAGLSLIPVLLAKLPLILWPVHIVFMELIIDPACTLIFEAEKEEPDIMNRKPRALGEKFFGGKKILLSCLQGIGILLVVLAIYLLGINFGYDEQKVRALTFTTLIVANIAVILTNRSWTRNIFQILLNPNYAVKWVVGGAILLLGLILNIPFLLELFQFKPIGFFDILLCTLAGLLTITWFELFKYFKYQKK